VVVLKAKYSCAVSNIVDLIVGIGCHRVGFSISESGIIIMLAWWNIGLRWPRFRKERRSTSPNKRKPFTSSI